MCTQNMADYCVFLDHFGSALIGVKAWQNNRMQKAISDILTIGDEAFLLTVVDGNYDKWMYDAIHHDDNDVDGNDIHKVCDE